MVKSKHTAKMREAIEAYQRNVDRELYNFINDVLRDRDALPITVGYLSEKQRKEINKSLNKDKTRSWDDFYFASRCVIDADAVRHIINRHGEQGSADSSMKDLRDIARMPYIIANFDEAEFFSIYSSEYMCADGRPAPQVVLKKRIDGTYYVIEAVTDSKANKSRIVSAYIDKSK